MSKRDLQTLHVLLWSGKVEDWQLWSMKSQVHGTACLYGDILDGNILVPTPEIIAKSTGETALQQVEEMMKQNKAGYVGLVMLINDMTSFNQVKEHEGDFDMIPTSSVLEVLNPGTLKILCQCNWTMTSS